MNIKLYRYAGERNKIDKSGDLVEVMTLTGQFKNDTSMLNPTLLLSLPPEASSRVTDENGNIIAGVAIYNNNAEVLDFNYFYVAEFRRYYYLTQFTISSNRIAIISGEVDPLYSFKSQILNNTAMIKRNEFDYDLSLVDSNLPFSDELKNEKTFFSTGIFNTTQDDRCIALSYYVPDDEFNALVTLLTSEIGDESEVFNILMGNKIIDFPDADAGFSGFLASKESPQFRVITRLLTTYELYKVLSFFTDDKKAFIKSVMSFPLNLPDCVEHIFYKDKWTESNRGCLSITNDLSNYVYLGKYDFPTYKFYEDKPYTTYKLHTPYLGEIEIDYGIWAGKRVDFYMNFSLSDGTANLYMVSGTIHQTIHFNLGRRVAIDKDNSDEIERQKTSMALNTTISSLVNIVSIAGGAITANPFMLAGGVTGMGGTIANSISQGINMVPKAYANSTSTTLGMTDKITTYIERIRKTRIDIDEDRYNHTFGRPLMKLRRLRDLTGFTIVERIHLENCTATTAEKEEIESSLLQGVIL